MHGLIRWRWTLNRWFLSAAERSQQIIASPEHLALFLLTLALWTPWAASRGFDAFSQLVVNTPTTLAEYLFGMLTLAAALAASRKADAILAELRTMQARALAEEDEALRRLTRLERLVATLDAQDDRGGHGALDG